jgi:hypothetical protein
MRALASAVVILIFGSLLLAGFWTVGVRQAGGVPGFPLDDAWIHVRFAQNLAEHGSFAFNPGEPTAGATSPLWVVLLAAGSLISGHFFATALALGILSYLALGLAVWLIGRRVLANEAAGLLAAAIVLVNVRMVWAALSGMEICLAALLAVVAAACLAGREWHRLATCSGTPDASEEMAGREWHRLATCPGTPAESAEPGQVTNLYHSRFGKLIWITPIIFGLASLARPEAHLLFGLAVFLTVARSCDRNTPVRELLRLIPYRMIGLYLLVVGPWHLFAWLSSGSVLPNTFWANFRGLATRIYPPGYYSWYGRNLFVGDHPWIYWFVIPGVIATLLWTLRQARTGRPPAGIAPFGLIFAQLAALWVITYPPASRTLIPMTRHHGRYMLPMTPFHAILAVIGLWAIMRLILWLAARDMKPKRSERIQTVAGFVLAAAVILSALPGLRFWAGAYGDNVYSINHQHVATARWLRDNVPANALIAAHDVGALGAVSRRRILDLFGLVTPGMLRRNSVLIPTLGNDPRWYLDQLRVSDATYLVGYPNWLGFLALAPDAFVEVHRESLKECNICGGLDMIVYRIERSKLAEARPGRRFLFTSAPASGFNSRIQDDEGL